MAASPALETRPLMDKQTFLDNFNNQEYPHETFLCYEVECPKDDFSIPLDERKGWLCNKGADVVLNHWQRRHAEPIFQDLMASWKLDKEQRYRVTCYISYSPCEACAYELAAFLRENRCVALRIFAARIYKKESQKCKDGLRTLKAAGAKVAIMTSKEFEHCWDNFVDHRERSFLPWEDLDVHSHRLSQRLETILQN